MIEEPKLIRIKRNTPRPTAAQIAALGNVPTGVVNDALWGRGALHKDIKPVDPYGQMGAHAVGAALTVETGPADILALLAVWPISSRGILSSNPLGRIRAAPRRATVFRA